MHLIASGWNIQSNFFMRLDKYIQHKHPGLTRDYIKKQIKAGLVLVNEKKVKPSHVLCKDDLVEFSPDFVLVRDLKIQPNPEIKLNIIYEDADIIALDKPAGLSVHPRQTKSGSPIKKEVSETLVSGLIAYHPSLADVGDQPKIRPGIVHRLDKDTSGVIIVAKNQKSFEWLKQQFKERKVQKKYIALIHGCPKESQGIIKTYLTRSQTEPNKQKVISATDKIIPRSGEREAITEYKVAKKFKDYCLIESRPKTGRLHQIRAQFAWLGYPIAGDAKYGNKKRPFLQYLNRQFLHAQQLSITLPNGQKKTFFSPLANDLTATIKKLEK